MTDAVLPTITFPIIDEMRTEMLALLDSHPDWVNPTELGSRTCTYWRDGRRCVVGQYVHDKGVGDATLQHMDGSFSEVADTIGQDHPVIWLDPDGDEYVLQWLDKIQGIADGCASEAYQGLNLTRNLVEVCGPNHVDPDDPTSGITPRRWGEVAQIIREFNL